MLDYYKAKQELLIKSKCVCDGIPLTVKEYVSVAVPQFFQAVNFSHFLQTHVNMVLYCSSAALRQTPAHDQMLTPGAKMILN